MIFTQDYYITESIFGNQHIRVVITDNINDLIIEEGNAVDCLLLETIKEDLNSDEGKFAVSELSFSINESAIKEEINKQCLWFCLSDVSKFIAVYFNPDYTSEATLMPTLLFVGKIDEKISGDDKVWYNTDFSEEINPLREYKFSAHTFDLSILSQVKLNDKIQKPDKSGYIDPLLTSDRLNAYIDWENSSQSIFKPRLMYVNAYPVNPNLDYQLTYTRPVASLYDVITLLFELSKEIILELEGTELEISLEDSDFGISVAPIHFNPFIDYTSEDYQIGSIPYELTDGVIKPDVVEAPRKIKLVLKETENEGESNVYIFRKMLFADYGVGEQNWEKYNLTGEKAFNFQSLNNLSELIYSIAKAFNCYLVAENTGVDKVKIKYISRQSISEGDLIYVIGSTDASIDVSLASSKANKNYYSLVSNKLNDGIDYLTTDWKQEIDVINLVAYGLKGGEPSELYKLSGDTRRALKDGKGTDSERLLFSTANSYELLQHGTPNHRVNQLVPINTWRSTVTPSNYEEPTTLFQWSFVSLERLSTAIILKDLPYITEQIEELGETNIYVHSGTVYVNINGDELEFEKLPDYLNRVAKFDKTYYETEYSWSIPFWNAFSTDGSYANCSLFNLKLGKKINVKQPVLIYDKQTESFTEETRTTTYVVTGIERSLNKPETKIKLMNVSRFSFTHSEKEQTEKNIEITGVMPPTSKEVKRAVYVAGENITQYNAVMLVGSTLYQATASSLDYGRVIGIALSSGDVDEEIVVQIAGEIYNQEWDWNSEYVYVRSGEMNLSIDPLNEPNNIEDVFIRIGKVTTPKSILIDIKQYVYQDGLIQP